MDIKKVLLISLIAVAILASVSAVSAGLLDFNNAPADIKTHEFNYANIATFNLSDELTNNTEVKDILFGDMISYEYPSKDGGDVGLYASFGGINSNMGSDPLELDQNNANREEIEKNITSQGYDAHIIKWRNGEIYDVYIDLDNITIIEHDGFNAKYNYFKGTFDSLEGAHIFIETFKINEESINEGV